MTLLVRYAAALRDRLPRRPHGRDALIGVLGVAVVAVACLIAAAQVARANAGQDPPWVDWVTYSNAFDRLVHGGPIYAASQLTAPYHLPDISRTGWVYPPAAVVFFAPFAGSQFGLPVWIALNVLLFATGIWAVMRREIGPNAAAHLGLASVAIALYPGLAQGIAVGNANVGLAGLFAWAWVLGRAGPIAPVAATGGIVKIVPGVLAFFATRDTILRRLAVVALAGLAVIVMTLPLTGIGAWPDFARALSNAQPDCVRPSVPCAISPLAGVPAAKAVAIGVAGVLCLGAVVVRSDLRSYALVTFAWLSALTDMELHALLPLLVLGVVVYARAVARARAGRAAGPGRATGPGLAATIRPATAPAAAPAPPTASTTGPGTP